MTLTKMQLFLHALYILHLNVQIKREEMNLIPSLIVVDFEDKNITLSIMIMFRKIILIKIIITIIQIIIIKIIKVKIIIVKIMIIIIIIKILKA